MTERVTLPKDINIKSTWNRHISVYVKKKLGGMAENFTQWFAVVFYRLIVNKKNTLAEWLLHSLEILNFQIALFQEVSVRIL